jgi:hypothetical protein
MLPAGVHGIQSSRLFKIRRRQLGRPPLSIIKLQPRRAGPLSLHALR